MPPQRWLPRPSTKEVLQSILPQAETWNLWAERISAHTVSGGPRHFSSAAPPTSLISTDRSESPNGFRLVLPKQRLAAPSEPHLVQRAAGFIKSLSTH